MTTPQTDQFKNEIEKVKEEFGSLSYEKQKEFLVKVKQWKKEVNQMKKDVEILKSARHTN